MLGARGATCCRVTGEVVLAEVSLRLDDDSARGALRRLALQDGPEHVARDKLGFAIVEITRKDPTAAKVRARPRAQKTRRVLGARDYLPAHYSLAVLLRLLRALRLA